MSRRPILPAAVVLTAATLAVAATVAPSRAATTASAAASASLATGTLGTVGSARASGDQTVARDAPAASAQPDGIEIADGTSRARTARASGDARADAEVTARGVSLLDGLVTASRVRRSASDAGGGGHRGGSVRGLTIEGTAVGDVSAVESYPLAGGRGTVTVNRGGAGLRVVLTADANGYPAGTEVTIAAVTASARDGAARATPTSTPTVAATAQPTATATPRRSAAERRASRAAQDRRRLMGSGFLFPVRGATTIGGPFGAPRADTGFHQGNDLFATFGTPVVAVADGTISKVGTLRISGNRLWLTTASGDAFFYAHLSAFSPNAVDGRAVQAGTLLGYVGNTGDAEPTPPHVHFEIHPRGGDAIDPNGFLVAWQERNGERGSAGAEQRPGTLEPVKDLITP